MTVPLLGAARLGARLTVPFERGADTLGLTVLPATSPGVAPVAAYDFSDHLARFNSDPQPRYVLVAVEDIDAATTVTLTYAEPGGAAQTAVVPVPAGTLSGASFVVSAPSTPTARITQIAVQPAQEPAQAFALTALLGNLAKLLWVLGAERDLLRRHATRTLSQRFLSAAVGPSLDLIGTDLGVPRFPPLQYGFDQGTIALYHLDDAPGATPAVADVTAAYPGRTGHPGVLVGAVQVGLGGRYGRAFGLRPFTAVEVATSTEFDIAATASFTAECFVRPDGDTGDGPVLIRQSATGATDPGWELAIGDFGRKVPRNVQLYFFDGTTVVQVFADLSLPTDSFTHLAGVLDRARGQVSLYVDGVLRASKPTGTLGAIAGTRPLRIGSTFGSFKGTVDEVRISSVARTDFAPALGEADEHYRNRLRIFRRWSLPTPANLTAILNDVVGPISNHPNALVVDDTNPTLVRGTRLVHIRPVGLLPGETIDGTGKRGVSEVDAVGTTTDEDTFDPAFLLRYAQPTVDFGTAPARVLRPGELAPDPHLVQVGVADRLDQLVSLAAAEPGGPGRLLVQAAFDPRADDLRATGRAVLLGHSTVPPGRLAALAQRAGFDFVAFRATEPEPAKVYAAAAIGEYLAIDLTPSNAGPTQITVGATAALSVRPPLPPDAFAQWLFVPGGVGRADLAPDGVPGSPQHTAQLHATAAGSLLVKVDVTRGHHTVSATRSLRIGLADLADKASVAADGTPGVPASIVDQGESGFFDPAFLIRHDDPRVSYGSDEANRFMQPTTGELLDALLDELDRRGATGQLNLTGAVNPNLDSAAAAGRRLTLTHPTLGPGGLGVAAFAVGFGYTARNGTTIEVRQPRGQLVQVQGPDGADRNGVIEIDEGATVNLLALPVAPILGGSGPGGGPAGGGGGPAGDGPPPPPQDGDPLSLVWATDTISNGRLRLGSLSQPNVPVTAVSAGTAWVQASFLIGIAPKPYTFAVRLTSQLSGTTTVISQDQFDLIMNILNTLHPVGVEVDTSAIRSHVIEIRGDLQQANPDFTYPKFRVRGQLPPQVKRSTSG